MLECHGIGVVFLSDDDIIFHLILHCCCSKLLKLDQGFGSLHKQLHMESTQKIKVFQVFTIWPFLQ